METEPLELLHLALPASGLAGIYEPVQPAMLLREHFDPIDHIVSPCAADCHARGDSSN